MPRIDNVGLQRVNRNTVSHYAWRPYGAASFITETGGANDPVLDHTPVEHELGTPPLACRSSPADARRARRTRRPVATTWPVTIAPVVKGDTVLRAVAGVAYRWWCRAAPWHRTGKWAGGTTLHRTASAELRTATLCRRTWAA